MWLKSLEVQGFKSFPDKTVLQFGSDITAIVGPNGSGKSNISDAICWVLGEQSTKALRGAKMEDVIFGGTQKRAPVGFAEATLVLDNSDGSLRIETPEVMITRRYYRSGESEYYINKQQARLRDINELFMDTGLGREGYSNIGQGRIDEILALKSTDRREIFEEAAGISKYRHRKEETERRLQNTEDNLMRIGDKISELELQVEPLREQAEKAQKYLTLRSELRGLEVTVWLDALERISADAKKAEQDYASAAFILEQAHSDLTKLYSQSEQLSLQLNQQSLLLDGMRDSITEMEAQRQQKQAELAVLQAGQDNHRENILRIQEELEAQKTRSGGISERIAQQLSRIDEIRADLAELNDQLASAAEDSRKLAGQVDEKERTILNLRANQALLQTENADRKAQIASLRSSLEDVLERRSALEGDRAAAQARLAQVQQQRYCCKKELNRAQEAVETAKNTIAGYELRLKTRQQKRDELKKEADACAVRLDTLDAKMRMLQELERDYEGFNKAVKLVMQEAGRGALSGIRGPVSKLIRVEDDYTTAVETALGAAIGNIVVDTEEDGKAAIQMLKRRDGGRATFLPMNTIRARRMEADDVSRMAGFVGIASELVRFDEKYRNIVESLLGKTVITETLDGAIRMARQTGSRFRIVTLDGQVMNVGGSMTGGSATRSAGVLFRANQLEKMAQEREKLASQAQTLRTQLAEAESGAAKTEFELQTVQGQLREAEDEALRRTEEEKQVVLLLDALEASIDGFEQELSRIEARSGGDTGKLSVLEQQSADAQQKLEQLERQAAALEESRSALDSGMTELNERITALRLSAAARDAERQSAQDSVENLRQLESALAGESSQKQALIADFERKIGELAAQMQSKNAEIEELQKQGTRQQEQLRQAVAERALLEQKRIRAEKQAQEKNADILNMERETARLEQKKTTGELEQKQLIDKLWDSYELTPTTAEAEKVEIESQAAAGRKIAEVRRKISALGTPNLGAIEEYARVSERYEYLSGQRDDVQHAKSELENIVKTITGEMTEIFTREFGRINEYFGKTFTEMFGGGKASLELEDASQPLECGIDIKVQPPGKQLKTITLLSGGEKAFVAIALYFAILKVRPTPFCMLDEIDAALDDRNVERFASYLRNLCSKTQFIVITHRRGTMEASDVLYGVTMQEQGISKILHLDLDELAKQLGITA